MSSTQKMAVGSQMCNAAKNRYSNVKPYDYNRVKLKKLKNQEGSDYINASFIDTYSRKRPLIATQAPLVETTADFWRMIYENKAWVIVMLGQEIEGGQLKANRFWPEEGHAMKLDDITVKFISIQRDSIDDVWIRQMEVMDEHGERKLVQFYQYQDWPVQKAINSKNIRSLIQLIDQSESWKKKLGANHIVVMSSSGIGRAGVFSALTSLKEEANVECSVDVFRSVQQLNQQRSSLVQTREEYSLIYTATLQVTEEARLRPHIDEVKHDYRDDIEDDERHEGATNGDAEIAEVEANDGVKKPSVKFQEDEEEAVKKPSVKFQEDEEDDVSRTPNVKFNVEDEKTGGKEGGSKAKLERVNTHSYDSKM